MISNDDAQFREFFHAVQRVYRVCRRSVDIAAREFGLTEATALPLIRISEMDEAPRQSTLADVLHIERPSVVWLIDQLAEMGLVERREDPEDKRAKRLYLTPEGRRITDRLHTIFQAGRVNLFSSVSRQDLEAAMRMMAQIEANADATSSSAEAVYV
jgi:MarR family transcriptional regulator for hemolysin